MNNIVITQRGIHVDKAKIKKKKISRKSIFVVDTVLITDMNEV
jgi:hypothetical protein